MPDNDLHTTRPLRATRAARPGPGYIPAMDGLRAVASLMIMTLHLAVLTGMLFRPDGTLGPLIWVVPHFWVAVPIFFAISGFLLYLPWATAAADGSDRPSVRAYYWHRVLRIMPAYLVLVAAALLAFYPEVFNDGWRLVRILLLQHIFVDGDLPHTMQEPPNTGAISQTWSLSTELHFYLILPVLALVLHRLLRRENGHRAAIGVLALLEVGSIVWKTTVSGTWRDASAGMTRWWLPGFLGFFAVGMLLAIVAVRICKSGARPAIAGWVERYPWACWVAALVAYAVVSSPLSEGSAVLEELCYLVVVAGLAAPLVLAPGKGPELLLRRRLPAFLGRISYGVFCWHIFVQMAVFRIAGLQWGTLGLQDFLLLLPLTGAITVLLAWLSYVLVERPLRRRFRLAPQVRLDTQPAPRPVITAIGEKP